MTKFKYIICFFFLDYLSQFVTTNTENKCKNNVVQLTAEEQLKKLSQGLEYVDQLICDQTYDNHEELFNQVTWTENLESIINEISSQIQNLQSSIELLKCKIVDLFVKVQTQVVILNRLHAICDLLRKIMRTQSLTLQTLDKENVMSPHSMLEIKELIEDKDLKEITFLSKDLIKLSNFCEKKKFVGLK
ncbi:conserved oligomeric Golgi complex subunit 5 [Aphis craccivora]|uniref:Conserved oligomeric Golgi complex subunit 5 n=1 Tax=Aphis craccivora TaxID=307492 RepID=A0A6G0ZN32_APHCR|nr:conserved oligomeric Golgi complex subunit 5 [Aphis craccivora]